MAVCEKCGKAILWLNHKTSGRPAPIEAEPNEKGNILIKGNEYRVAKRDEIQKANEIGHPLFLNHFAACEFAQSFRKGK